MAMYLIPLAVFTALGNLLGHHRVQAIFKSRLSGVLVPLFVTLAFTFLQIGLAFNSSFTWAFRLAYIFGTLALIWAIGWWLTSPFLKKRNTQKTRQQRRGRTPYSRRNYLAWKWCPCLPVLVIFIACVMLIHESYFAKQVEALNGWLIPGSESSPVNSCTTSGDVPPHAMLLYLGDSVFYTTTFPHTVIMVDGQPRLTVGKNERGQISVTADIFGRDNRIIASLEKNEFAINPNNHFKSRRNDLSSLEVIDQYKQAVLSVRFLNPSAIKIMGLLYYPGHNPIQIRENVVELGTRRYSRVCGGDSSIADISVWGRSRTARQR